MQKGTAMMVSTSIVRICGRSYIRVWPQTATLLPNLAHTPLSIALHVIRRSDSVTVSILWKVFVCLIHIPNTSEIDHGLPPGRVVPTVKYSPIPLPVVTTYTKQGRFIVCSCK